MNHHARLPESRAGGRSDCEADKSEAGRIAVGAMENGVHIRRTRHRQDWEIKGQRVTQSEYAKDNAHTAKSILLLAKRF